MSEARRRFEGATREIEIMGRVESECAVKRAIKPIYPRLLYSIAAHRKAL
jgi:hypothetical protein